MDMPKITGEQAEELEIRLADAVEDALGEHDMRDLDAECSCGARNNMDGDVLHGHRSGAISEAIGAALGKFFDLT